MDTWTKFWQRHDELVKLSSSYGTQGGQPWYHFETKDGRHVFLNRDTLQEVELPLSDDQYNALAFGSTLWQKLPFLATLYRSAA